MIFIVLACLFLLVNESLGWAYTLNRHARWLSSHPVYKRRAFIKTTILSGFSALSGLFCVLSWGWVCHIISIYNFYNEALDLHIWMYVLLSLGIQITHIHMVSLLARYSCLPQEFWPFLSRLIHKILVSKFGRDSVDKYCASIENWKDIVDKSTTHRGLLVNFLDLIPDLVWTKDEEGRYTYSNNIANEVLLGMTTAEVIGKTSIQVADEIRERGQTYTFGELCARSDLEVLEGRKVGFFFESGFIKDRELALRVMKAPIFDADNELSGIIGIARNVTWQMENYERIEELLKTGRFDEALTAFVNYKNNFQSFRDHKDTGHPARGGLILKE